MLSAPADQGWPLLSFEAYEGAGKIPIRSDASLRRLLAAIQNLGLPVRDKELPAGGMAYHPPVLRFYLDGWAREPVADTTTVGGPEDAGNGATSADDIADAGEDDDLKRKRSKASPASPSPETRRQRPGPKRVKALPIRLGTNPHEDKVEQEVEDQERPYEAPRMAPQPPAQTGPVVIDLLSDPVEEEEEQVDDQELPPDEVEVKNQRLSLEEMIRQDENEGFTRPDSLHDEDIHNLYADIAGISRDQKDPSNSKHCYKPPYSTIALRPYQTYPTGWLLQDSGRILHYLADRPGLGKTFEAIEMMVRLTMILSNQIAITNEREAFGLQTRPRSTSTRLA